jgi:hypothetical protein
MPRILTLILLVCLAACTFKTVTHDGATAASTGKVFLKALYLDHDANRALSLADEQLRKSATAAQLTDLAKTIDQHCGGLKELRADSFAMLPGQTMQVFFTGTCEKKTLYHRLVMFGSVQEGYRVGGVWFQDTPYPEHPLRQKLNQNIVVE